MSGKKSKKKKNAKATSAIEWNGSAFAALSRLSLALADLDETGCCRRSSSSSSNNRSKMRNQQLSKEMKQTAVGGGDNEDDSGAASAVTSLSVSEAASSMANGGGEEEAGEESSSPSVSNAAGAGVGVANNVNKIRDSASRGLFLSHWRDMPETVASAYKMLEDGAALIKATSTKYTLVGKICPNDGAKLAQDLQKGAELIGAAALLIHDDTTGCGRSTRHYTKQTSRSVIDSVMALIQSFTDGTALVENVGAQRTGVVWSACDAALSKIPKGNRSAMRRELLTWASECNETMDEFQRLVDLGPSVSEKGEYDVDHNDDAKTSENNDDDDDDEGWDDFCMMDGTGQQYAAHEIGVVQSCLALLKCSRGTIGATLKACENAGDKVSTLAATGADEDQSKQRAEILQWISDLHELTRVVGEGVTDLGALLYPPLDLTGTSSSSCSLEKGSSSDGDENTRNQQGGGTLLSRSTLGRQIALQRDAIISVTNFILDLTPQQGSAGEKTNITSFLSKEITELATKLRNAAQNRSDEAEIALEKAQEGSKDQ